MKIEIEIDDKYKNTNLHLMWGMVPIARYRWPNKYWEIKTEFCSQCGKCCTSLEDKNHPFGMVNGQCEYLKDDPGGGASCLLGILRPFGCCTCDLQLQECTVKWERVN